MTLTESAADYLYEKVTSIDVPQHSVMRLTVNGNAIGMAIGREEPEDTVVLYKKILIAALTRETAHQLESSTVDFLSTKDGGELVLNLL